MKRAKKKQLRESDAEGRELLALARESDRKHGNWNVRRSKAVAVSEAELLALGGGKQVVWRNEGRQTWIVFGGKDEAQLVFKPHDGAWMVALEGVPSREELRRELSKAGRGLWNPAEAKQGPDIAFHAVDALLTCFESFKGLPSNKQQKAEVQFAIVATLEALERDTKTKARKLQLAFALLTDGQWSHQIEKLLSDAVKLACDLQRPPYKGELRKNFDPQERIKTSNFATLLRHAGLSWLPKKPRTRVS